MMVLFLTRLLAAGFAIAGLSPLQPLLLLQLLFLLAFLALCVSAGPWGDSDAILAIIAGMFGVTAMAGPEAALEGSLGKHPNTGGRAAEVTHTNLEPGR